MPPGWLKQEAQRHGVKGNCFHLMKHLRDRILSLAPRFPYNFYSYQKGEISVLSSSVPFSRLVASVWEDSPYHWVFLCWSMAYTQCQQHCTIPRNQPSKYWPHMILLNFGVLMETGAVVYNLCCWHSLTHFTISTNFFYV